MMTLSLSYAAHLCICQVDVVIQPRTKRLSIHVRSSVHVLVSVVIQVLVSVVIYVSGSVVIQVLVMASA